MKNDLRFLLSRFVSENILMNHNRTNVYKKQTGVTALHDGKVIRNFTFYTLLTIRSFCLEILESPLRTDMNRTASTQLPWVPHYKTDIEVPEGVQRRAVQLGRVWKVSPMRGS